MRQILSHLIRSQRFQDTASVLRGIYRVTEGLTTKTNPDNTVLDLNRLTSTVGESEKQEYSIDVPEEDRRSREFKENRVPDTQLSRVFQFGVLGAKLAGNALGGYIRGRSFKESAVSEQNAELLAQGLCKMRGAPLKLAQALSIQEDKLIPEHIRKAFEQARETANTMPKYQLHLQMEKELGPEWRTKFDEFDEVPFAAASIGQVHRAIIKGKEVAVKIQYPGVRESIDSDMNNLKLLMDYSGVFPKTMFMDKLLDHTRKELFEECDYQIEAQKQERYRQLLIDSSKQFAVPKVYTEYSTMRILTAEYLNGDSIDYAAAHYPQKLRDEIGRRIMDLTLRELFEWRFMQSDPNPSNFYYRRQTDQIILLDFGAAHEYSKKFIDLYIQVIHSAVKLNREVCLQKSQELGFLTGEESLRMKDAHVDSVITVGEPFQKNEDFDFGKQVITDKVYQLMPVMLKYRLKPPPPEVYSLHRKLSGAYLINMKLQSRVNCHKIFMNLYNKYQFN